MQRTCDWAAELGPLLHEYTPSNLALQLSQPDSPALSFCSGYLLSTFMSRLLRDVPFIICSPVPLPCDVSG